MLKHLLLMLLGIVTFVVITSDVAMSEEIKVSSDDDKFLFIQTQHCGRIKISSITVLEDMSVLAKDTHGNLIEGCGKITPVYVAQSKTQKIQITPIYVKAGDLFFELPVIIIDHHYLNTLN